jgi:hypothetical protein
MAPGDAPLARRGASTRGGSNLAAGATGSDVLRGRVSGLPVDANADEQCLADNTAATTLTDAALPGAGDSFWYLVRGDNACGEGPYGFQAFNGVPTLPRLSTKCP